MTADDHIWSEEAVFAKARLYVQRAADAEPGSGPAALWSLLGLEFLARAALARIHPALLADPRPEGPHLLYAFGYGDPKPPRSIMASTVLQRCQVAIPGFTAREVEDASALFNLRNGEIHTGSTALEELRSSSWMPQYYRVSEVLLEFLGLGLQDLFSPEEAASARKMIEVLEAEVEHEVKERVAQCRRDFERLEAEEQEQRRKRGWGPQTVEVAGRPVVPCPVCQTRERIDGEESSLGPPRVGESDIERTTTVLPTGFKCSGCGLRLSGHAEMHYAGLGDQQTLTKTEDPISFYGINPTDYVSAEDFFDEDYGNE